MLQVGLINLVLSGCLNVFLLGNVYISPHRFSDIIRKVTVSTGIITAFAGSSSAGYSGDGGEATSATLNPPLAVGVDSSGKPTVVGLLITSLFTRYLCALQLGNLYIADGSNHRIRKVTAVTPTSSPRYLLIIIELDNSLTYFLIN